jgi:Helix-turn-helix domain of alkylmercury lyase
MTIPESIERLADRLQECLQRDNPAVFLQLLQLLADGRPVPVEQLAATLHISRDEVTTAVHQTVST